jgi:hypothetical protein
MDIIPKDYQVHDAWDDHEHGYYFHPGLSMRWRYRACASAGGRIAAILSCPKWNNLGSRHGCPVKS